MKVRSMLAVFLPRVIQYLNFCLHHQIVDIRMLNVIASGVYKVWLRLQNSITQEKLEINSRGFSSSVVRLYQFLFASPFCSQYDTKGKGSGSPPSSFTITKCYNTGQIGDQCSRFFIYMLFSIAIYVCIPKFLILRC